MISLHSLHSLRRLCSLRSLCFLCSQPFLRFCFFYVLCTFSAFRVDRKETYRLLRGCGPRAGFKPHDNSGRALFLLSRGRSFHCAGSSLVITICHGTLRAFTVPLLLVVAVLLAAFRRKTVFVAASIVAVDANIAGVAVAGIVTVLIAVAAEASVQRLCDRDGSR